MTLAHAEVRLIAHAARIGDAMHASVEPVMLPDWHLLASVEEEYNAVYMKTASSGDLSLFGKGAGALPTATAMLGDLIDLHIADLKKAKKVLSKAGKHIR